MLQPVINLLVLLSTLGVVAERLANIVKPRHPGLRESKRTAS
jgi:hypothetical protein